MTKKKYDVSALPVNKGISQPLLMTDKAAKKNIRRKNEIFSAKKFVERIVSGDRIFLSRAITLVESSLPKHHNFGQKIIEKCIPYSGKSVRIGITGVPGAGKSTFIEAFGKYLTSQGLKTAVLAVDPSSEISGGSILGDKTRMEELSNNPDAFIRPSPSTGNSGGVAKKTRDCIILCEAAGFDIIIIETVGVGQAETAVHSMVDFFLLIMLAGAGDELQGIKRGIMEMADAIIINKADGNNVKKAEQAKAEFQNALHMFSAARSGWTTRVECCSSIANTGIDGVWKMIREYVLFTKQNGYFDIKRQYQSKYGMLEIIHESLREKFYENKEIKKLLPEVEKDLLSGKISASKAAKKMLDIYFKKAKTK